MQCCSGWACPSLKNRHLMWQISYSGPRILRQRSLYSPLDSSIYQNFATLTELSSSQPCLIYWVPLYFSIWGRESNTQLCSYVALPFRRSNGLLMSWKRHSSMLLLQPSKISSTATYGQTYLGWFFSSKTGTLVNTCHFTKPLKFSW